MPKKKEYGFIAVFEQRTPTEEEIKRFEEAKEKSIIMLLEKYILPKYISTR